MTGAVSLRAWLQQRRDACKLRVDAVPFASCDGWSFREGRLEERSGSFFSITGFRVSSNVPGLVGLSQVIILQPEVGLQGFIARPRDGQHDWLVQAKTEPGNLLRVQLAPTVQATVSNYMRRHGGRATVYLEHFLDPEGRGRVVADSLQSEQGSRFVAKYNRNMTVVVAGPEPEPTSDGWCWYSSADLRGLLLEDFAINTDARSVLFTSDWRLLADDGEAFGRWRQRGGLGEALLESNETPEDESETSLGEILAVLDGWRSQIQLKIDMVGLESLLNWEIRPDGIFHARPGICAVRAMAVEAPDREVARWCQPFVMGEREETFVMLCQRRRGRLHFLLRASAEPGFRERVQFGPTYQSDDTTGGFGRAGEILVACAGHAPRLSVLQSDEGSRFYRAVARYSLMELPADAPLSAEGLGVWATLAQIRRMAQNQGVFSNEARSLLSLVLAFA